MSTVLANNKWIVIDDSDPKIKAYDALKIASTKLGLAGYGTSDAIEDLQLAMSDVLSGDITVEEAMGLLHFGHIEYTLQLARRGR